MDQKNQKDMTEKTLEAQNDVFADIMNVLLFDGRQEVTEDELEQALPRSVYKADGKLREQERDAAKYWHRMRVRIAFFGMENQTEPDVDMPLRVISYDGAVYRNQLGYTVRTGRRRKKGKWRRRRHRYPAVTLVLYFGTEQHWNQPVTLYGALGGVPESLRPYVNDYRINLVEVAWLTDEQVQMFRSDFKVVADYFVQKRKNGEYQPSIEQLTHVQEVMQLMSALTGDDRFEKAYQQSREEETEAKNMCEILDKVENRGIQRGLERGLEQKDIVLVKKKMRKNKSIPEIADALEETEEYVRRIYDMIRQLGIDTSDAEIYKRLHA